jgi:hypothetical protein
MTKTTTIDPKLIDQLLEQTPTEDLLGKNGLIKQFAFLAPTAAPSGLGPQSHSRASPSSRDDHTLGS